MKLSDLVKASNTAGAKQQAARKQSLLIYGPPKVGKTELAGTIVKLPTAERIFWFDLENGADTLVDMYHRGKITLEQMEKVILIRVPDVRDSPIAMETLLKAICTRQAVDICEEHGRVNCAECKKTGGTTVKFDHKSLGPNDWIVIDSLSQAATSALNMACLGKGQDYKPGWDEYGLQGKWISDLLTTIQAAPHCNFICITHVQILEDADGKDIYTPLCGTKSFSSGVAKFFGTVIYCEMKMKQHKAGSSTTYNVQTQTGSRLGIALEKEKEPDLSVVLPRAGIGLPASQIEMEPTDESVKEVIEETVKEKPSFLNRVNAAKK